MDELSPGCNGAGLSLFANLRLRRHILTYLFILSGCLGACMPTSPQSLPNSTVESTSAAGSLNVFSAASLADAFTELGRQFEAAHPGVRVNFNFAGSQQLAQQLAQGAPADVFASADQAQMKAAVDAGRVLPAGYLALVENSLVVGYSKNHAAGLRELQDLAQPGLKLILADAGVPAGKYSLVFLEMASQDPLYGASFKEKVLKNVVSYEENVRSVLAKVALGEADAGIVYASDVQAAGAEQVGLLQIPPALNVKARYYIAPLGDSQHPALAQDFVSFVLSPVGQQVLANFGFQTVH